VSDVPQGQDWWQGSDSKWYPPEVRTNQLSPSPIARPPRSGRRGLIALLIVIVLIGAGVGTYVATSSSAVALTGASSCSTSDHFYVYNGRATFEYGEPTVNAVALQGFNGGLKATWTFDGPLQNEPLGTFTTFLITAYPARNARGDATKWISLGASNGSGKGWSALAASYTTNHAVAAPIVSGNTFSVGFPQKSLSGWISQPFWWSAQEQTVQFGIPTGDPSDPINTSVGGGAIVGCPSPSGGYQSESSPDWTSRNLVQFPGGHQTTVGGSVPPSSASPPTISTYSSPTTRPISKSSGLGPNPLTTAEAQVLCPEIQTVISTSGVTVDSEQRASASAGGTCQYGSGSNAVSLSFSSNPNGAAYDQALKTAGAAAKILGGFGGPAFEISDSSSRTVTVTVDVGPELLVVSATNSYLPGGITQFAQNIEQFAQEFVGPTQQALRK
jgi:hypothetical protein